MISIKYITPRRQWTLDKQCGSLEFGSLDWESTLWESTLLGQPILELVSPLPVLMKRYVGPLNANIV